MHDHGKGGGGGGRVWERGGCGEGEGVCLLLEAFAIYLYFVLRGICY